MWQFVLVILESMAVHRLFILESMAVHRLCLKKLYFFRPIYLCIGPGIPMSIIFEEYILSCWPLTATSYFVTSYLIRLSAPRADFSKGLKISALQASFLRSMLNTGKMHVEDNFGRLLESASFFVAMLNDGLQLLGVPTVAT
jgi:hypothetical protein